MASSHRGSSNRHTAADYTDFAHTGPGTLAGRYLRLFLQPIYLARDLSPGWAKPIRVMSEDFTLYRGESLDAPVSTRPAVHLVAFRCAHRGTQLSTGWVEGDCIRCFYHGWKYDGAGQCVEQPAEDAAFASKVKLRSYPVHETAGLIFAYLGEADGGDAGALRPPPPYFPEFEEGYAAQAYGGIWPCNYFTQLDNAVDTLHTTFVHWQFGRGVQTLQVEPLESGLVVHPHGPGAGYPNFFHMPNSHERATPPPRRQT